jgi:hypothetical protein
MKQLITLITVTLLSTISYGQDMKVKWNENGLNLMASRGQQLN